jgi:ABC-type uncharacterized transport system substrate-binding protein
MWKKPKMSKKVWLFLVVLVSVFALFPGKISNGKEGHDLPQSNNGRPWRIAYCESGQFVNYASTLYAVANGLAELDWLDAQGLPYTPGQKESKAMWDWLGKHNKESYLEFVPDAYYSFEHLGPEEKTLATQQIMKRLNERQDIDMILVMGTGAGQLLANPGHTVPMLVFSSSNAVQAGIVQSDKDSGLDHVWAHLEPTRYQRQIEIFHDLFAFRKLGMVYEDSPEGRLYAALDDVKKVAAQRGFEIRSVFVKDKQNNQETHRTQMLAAYHTLANEGVDAIYCSLYLDRDITELAEIFAPLYKKQIPIFAQMGAMEVEKGALLSVYRADFVGFGKFAAHTITQVFHGEKPRKLPQVYENTPSIVLNLEVAEKIGYHPPFEVFLVTDEIYPHSERGKE